MSALGAQKSRAWLGWPVVAPGLVLLVALLERWALFVVYPAKAYNDTGAYRRLAGNILRGWGGYDGSRVPGYPLLLAWVGPDERVYLSQLAMGVAVTLLMFGLGWLVSGSPRFGALIGLAHTLNLGQLFFEANLMSETLSTFFVVLAVAGAAVWIQVPGRRSVFLATAIGVAAACAALTRPLFLFLPFWIGLAVAIIPSFSPAYHLAERLRRLDWRFLALTCLPALVMFAVWMNFIHRKFGMWNITTMTGFNLIQHTGYYFEDVPDQYAKIRDIYLHYRDERIAQYGTQGNAIWDAIPPMRKATGMNFSELSTLIAKLSVQLIWEHPGLYLQYAVQGWWFFWRAPVYWAAENLRPAGLASWVGGAVLLERAALFGANLVFLGSSLVLAFWSRARQALRLSPLFWLVAATIWVTSVLQTLPDHGDNPRFLIPMQSLVIFWVLWLVFQVIRYAREHAQPVLFHRGQTTRPGSPTWGQE